MTNKIFNFSDTYWLQLSGTKMGMPAAFTYGTLTFGQYEISTILTEMSHNILYYKCYIDDVIRTRIAMKRNGTKLWDQFKDAGVTYNGR
jgi:hypothetical protein